ncbi:MAG: preprotein translocase subunit SecE [Nitrososphaerota archaeon]|nr:preprotein translocase subunit SecE [Nitrososphaerota archaeon]MDG6922958.1 preprotein translocase subunit SecE [Nitrososphaerota archaeon]
MGVGKALESAWRTLKLTRKSDREEFFLYLKLVLIGFGIVGALGFLIYFVASMVMLAAGVSNANPSGATSPSILFGLIFG